MYYKNKFAVLSISIFLAFNISVSSIAKTEIISSEQNIQAVQTTQESKYPDYAKMYTGEDKHEAFNRKMFRLNTKLNKYVAKPVHILWSSIMPKFGIDRIRDAYNNIEYPKRLVSCILQKDGQGVKTETLRFLTNSTIGLGGLFDPADKIFKLQPTNENMEQALCKCKMGSGSYLVMPILHSCTPRSLCGRALEAALDPSVYLASPITSAIKFGLMLNRTSYMQPLAQMIEMTYADPYDIHKKLFGMENYIKNQNLDRKDLLNEEKLLTEEGRSDIAEELIAEIGDEAAPVEKNTDNLENEISEDNKIIQSAPGSELSADITIEDYKSQTPVIDSMRTAFFDKDEIYKSIWNELSIWNRSFWKRIKTGKVEITEGKTPYQFKYLLQKDKNSPVVILYPSIGEGVNAHHSVVFAKLFYDAGYSVIIQGSHFHWEFVKSMPDGYKPGLPYRDSIKLKLVTSKIVGYLENKYDCKFRNKTVVGTSLGAMAALFLANNEAENQSREIDKFIAISPPIDLKYALTQLDKNAEEYSDNPDEVKQKTAVTAAKILQLYKLKDTGKLSIETLPFSDEEGKLITTFILRQKLSDLVFAIENIKDKVKTDLYKQINNMSYRDYAEKYLGINSWNDGFTHPVNSDIYTSSEEAADNITSLLALNKYFKENDNYKIYQSLDDYFTNKQQIAKLKTLTGKHMTCINCGAHLGFLYRKEFENVLMSELKQNTD